VIVRVNDRGPFLHDRLIDLSYAAAYRLGVVKTGTARVEVTAVGPGARSSSTVAIGTVDTTEDKVAVKPLPPRNRLSPISKAEASTDTPQAARGVFLQVGSFSVWDNAIKLRDQLERANIRPTNIATVNVNNKRYFRVRVGPIDNLGEAERINNKVQQLGIHDGRVVID